MNISKLDQAISLAAMAHKDQTRKAGQLPYIIHPYSVGMLLSQIGCSEDVIIAGILHDTVEDTYVTLEDIQAQFGRKVGHLVAGASESDKSLAWEERKQHTLDTLQTASLDVCLVVCADKCHNVQSLLEEKQRIGDQIWGYFHGGKDKQAWYYQSIVNILQKRLGMHPLIENLIVSVDKLFLDKE